MAEHIQVNDVKAWVDGEKLGVTNIDDDLEAQESAYVLARLNNPYDVSSWVDAASTPTLVRKIIAMRYASWLYDRAYSEDSEPSNYGALLRTEADKLLMGLIDGSIVIPNLPTDVDRTLGSPGFYPTDDSSALEPTVDDTSLGAAKFSMGQVF